MQHPCILRFFGSVDDGCTVSLITEYADAGDLQQLLRQVVNNDARLEELAVMALFSQIADAVCYVHTKRVLHRDLKPSNVMLSLEGRAKLGDFGVAKVIAGSAVSLDRMTCVGSPIYMAPEVVGGQIYGAACDVWSLGVILYELCTLRKPFHGRSLGEVAMRIMTGSYEPMEGNGTGVDVIAAFAKPLVERMLVLEADERAGMREIVSFPIIRMCLSSAACLRLCVADLVRRNSVVGAEEAGNARSGPEAGADALLSTPLATPAPAEAKASDLLPAGDSGAFAGQAATVRSTFTFGTEAFDTTVLGKDIGGLTFSGTLDLQGTLKTQTFRDPDLLKSLLEEAAIAEVAVAVSPSPLPLDANAVTPSPHSETPPHGSIAGDCERPRLDSRDTQAESRIHRLDLSCLQTMANAVTAPGGGGTLRSSGGLVQNSSPPLTSVCLFPCEVRDERMLQRQRARSRGLGDSGAASAFQLHRAGHRSTSGDICKGLVGAAAGTAAAADSGSPETGELPLGECGSRPGLVSSRSSPSLLQACSSTPPQDRSPGMQAPGLPELKPSRSLARLAAGRSVASAAPTRLP
eukprot:TRINITY_DN16252_c0_g1_i4.p1 TRINITY_DN16252_c0_g1~~TRINITY_DN16252_c0_g1_i4.p1  ORF type:complete len:577 (+),score=135.17 TRINITY_DN16252_c0_g1_i4:227-1957(+)